MLLNACRPVLCEAGYVLTNEKGGESKMFEKEALLSVATSLGKILQILFVILFLGVLIITAVAIWKIITNELIKLAIRFHKWLCGPKYELFLDESQYQVKGADSISFISLSTRNFCWRAGCVIVAILVTAIIYGSAAWLLIMLVTNHM